MPVLSAAVLSFVFVVAVSVLTFAFRERISLAKEVAGIVAGINRRTEIPGDAPPLNDARVSSELEELLDEAVQFESHQLAVLAVNELGGRAGLRRSRALLLSRGLPRIALLSGGGGAFVVAAVGNFSHESLGLAVGSVLLGLVCSFGCIGVNSASRRLAKKYIGIVDVLAREVERHFELEVPAHVCERKGDLPCN